MIFTLDRTVTHLQALYNAHNYSQMLTTMREELNQRIKDKQEFRLESSQDAKNTHRFSVAGYEGATRKSTLQIHVYTNRAYDEYSITLYKNGVAEEVAERVAFLFESRNLIYEQASSVGAL